MPLSDTEIINALESGTWKAQRDGKPLSAKDLTIGPNSVNLSLGAEILNIQHYIGLHIDLHNPDSFHAQPIQAPFTLQPGNLYLAAVRESFDCSAPLWIPKRIRKPDFRDTEGRQHYKYHEYEEETYFYPEVDGRSTCGRIGLAIHQTAGKGDYFFSAPFTLELTVIHPTRVHAGDEIGQVYFSPLQGIPSQRYQSVYAGQNGPTPARLGKERFQR